MANRLGGKIHCDIQKVDCRELFQGQLLELLMRYVDRGWGGISISVNAADAGWRISARSWASRRVVG